MAPARGARAPAALLILVAARGSLAVHLPQHEHRASANYSVVINTFKRAPCLRKALNRWRECNPTEIRVTWSEPEDQIPPWLHTFERQRKVVVDRFPTTNLTNRFRPRDFASDAVFSVDDDVIYKCEAVESAARQFWEDPRRMVGFAPRWLPPHGHWHAYSYLHANTVYVTKGGFLHRSFYDKFFSAELEQLRDWVDDHITGEDMLMGFLYAQTSKLPVVPMVMPKNFVEEFCNMGHLSGKSGQYREALLKLLYSKFGDVFSELETTAFLDVVNATPLTSWNTSGCADI